ncbi:MAG TPA: hypothetical protein VM243_01895 [Phycisphaerae bacterium]|nr:hypothetical protein [Phycisphaerae bacterium]
MNTQIQTVGRTDRPLALSLILLALPALLGGCDGGLFGGSSGSGSSGGTQNLNAGDDTGGGTTSDHLSLTGDVALSGAREYTVLYTVPTNATSVRAFYVADGEEDDTDAWTYFDFPEALSAGSSQFTINTADLVRGTWRIGVSYVLNGQSRYVVSSGRLIIQGLPAPTFGSPAEATIVVAGATISIAADVSDPEDDSAWRLFYISQQAAPDLDAIPASQVGQLGTELATGTGNAASYSWSTASVAVGTYLIGISATDSGSSVSATASSGDADQIVTVYNDFAIEVIEKEPQAMPPEITIAGRSDNPVLFLSGSVEMSFTAQIFEGTLEDVQVFYDQDNIFGNGIGGLITSGDSTLTSATLNFDDVDEGVYYLGVSADDGKNDRVVDYTDWTVSVVKTTTLTVTSPGLAGVSIRPSETVTLSWSTNVPSALTRTEVFALQDADGNGVGEGSEITIQEPTSASGASVSWMPTGLIGRFLIGVRLLFNDTLLGTVTAFSEGHVRVSTSPSIIWVGSFAEDTGEDLAAGAIFEGVQPEDNLGSAFAPVGDLDSDGNDEFLIAARFGKPFFANAEGIGHGEAYLIYGQRNRLAGRYNVNSVGTTLRGVTFTGIRTRQGNTETDGLSDVASIPDVDEDGKRELVFGYPFVESRGHNVDPDQNGVKDPEILSSLERPNQFLRGGIVIVSSTNSILRSPEGGTPVINLDLVGQRFERTCVLYEPGTDDEFVDDIFSQVGDTGNCFDTSGLNGSCTEPAAGNGNDATNINWGFVAALAEDYFTAMDGRGCLTEYEYHLNTCQWLYPDGKLRDLVDYCEAIGPGCFPLSPALHGGPSRHPDTTVRGVGYSGYYPDTYDTNEDGAPDNLDPNDVKDNDPVEPFGARIIGVGIEDGFGTSITLSNPFDTGAGDMIVSAPNRTARGILFQAGQTWQPDWPEAGGEITGLERPAGTPATNPDSGVGYLFDLRSLWTPDGQGRIPPKPHQYIVGEPSHCGNPPAPAVEAFTEHARIANVDAVRIAGASNEKTSSILGIQDFNGDGINDFAAGAPDADGGNGRVYIAFRRDPALEGDYVLEKIELAVTDAERLSGALITGTANSQFAFNMATDVDLNGDGNADLIVGAPGANGDTGEVVIIYSSPSLITPANGTTVDELVAEGRASKITGFDIGDFFGFNITNAGDIDNDGYNDLLIAAPGATPHYDADPFDADDTLDTPGLDLDGDGQRDDVTGPFGVPDGQVDTLDQLADAGLVYIIWGSNCLSSADCPNISTGANEFSIADLGATGLEGAIIVGRRAGDYFGGGDAGDPQLGGVSAKQDRGRSYGLRAAGDVDGDGLADIVVGSLVATPRIDPTTGEGVTHGGEAYLIYGFGR